MLGSNFLIENRHIRRSSGSSSGPIVNTAPSVSPEAAQVGTQETRTQGNYTPDGGGSADVTTSEWRMDGVQVGTGATYTPVLADHGKVFTYYEQATQTGGAADGATVEQEVSIGTVVHAAPVAAGGIADQSYEEDIAISTLDVAADFTGSDITYALAPSSAALPTGLSLSSAGQLTGTPTTPAAQVNIVVRGTNDGGFADTAYGVTITEAFSVSLASDGELEINGNDGRNFTLDDDQDRYDGTYSVDELELASGPVALKAPVLAGDADPAAGETLTIIPALFAYNPNLGDMTVSYLVVGTNGSETVDVTDPDNPTLLVDPAAIGTTLSVTATATQGANSTDSTSNGVAIAAAASGLQVDPISIQDESTSTATPSWIIDDSGYGSGDILLVAYGGADTPTVFTVGGVDVLANLIHTNASGGSDRRIRIYSLTLSGAGSASTAVNVTVPNPATNHILEVVGIKNGVLGSASPDGDNGAQTGALAQITATVTPAGANNAIVVFVLGRDGMFTAGQYSLTDSEPPQSQKIAEISSLKGLVAGGVIALAEDVPVAPYSANFDGDPAAGTDDHAVIASVAITETP